MIIQADPNEIPDAISYIRDTLKEKKIAGKDVAITALRAEDIIGAMIRHAAQLGIPAEAISLIMGLYSLVGMMQTCTNVTGDAAVTLVVARSEGMLDREIYDKGAKS